MWRKININISEHDYWEIIWENVNINIKRSKPEYLSPREKAHTV